MVTYMRRTHGQHSYPGIQWNPDYDNYWVSANHDVTGQTNYVLAGRAIQQNQDIDDKKTYAQQRAQHTNLPEFRGTPGTTGEDSPNVDYFLETFRVRENSTAPNSAGTGNTTGARSAELAAWAELMAFRREVAANMPGVSKKWSWSFLCGETAQAHIDALSSTKGKYWTVDPNPYWRGSSAAPGVVTGHAVVLFRPTRENPFPAHVIDPFDVPLNWKSALSYFTTYAARSEWRNGTPEVYNRDYWIQDKPYDSSTPTVYVPGFPPKPVAADPGD